MSGYSDLAVYESEAERHAVCAELARMLRIVPLNLSSATAAATPGGVATPYLPVAVVDESSHEQTA